MRVTKGINDAGGCLRLRTGENRSNAKTYNRKNFGNIEKETVLAQETLGS